MPRSGCSAFHGVKKKKKSAKCLGDLMTIFLLRKFLKTMFYQTTYSTNSSFALIGFKVMPQQFYIPVKFSHHVEYKLTAKLTCTTIRPKPDGNDLRFLFDFVDKEIFSAKLVLQLWSVSSVTNA